MVTLASVLSTLQLELNDVGSKSALELSSLAPLDVAGEGQLSFLASAKFRRQLESTKASVVLVGEKDAGFCPSTCIVLVVEDPYLAYAKVSQLFDQTPAIAPGIHPSAIVSTEAKIDASVCIGPNAVIGRDVVLGPSVQIGANVTIEDGAAIGAFSRIGANAVVNHRCVIGEYCLIQNGTIIMPRLFLVGKQ